MNIQFLAISHFSKTLLHYCVKQKSFKMLQLLYPSLMTKLSTPPFFLNFFKNLKKHMTLLTYLLPCLAARVPVTSSRH